VVDSFLVLLFFFSILFFVFLIPTQTQTAVVPDALDSLLFLQRRASREAVKLHPTKSTQLLV